MWKNTCKLLLFDLDGTLLQSDKTISKRTLSVLKQCREKGILIGVSTSRSEQNSLAYLNELMQDILISSGGALVKCGDEYIYKAEFSVAETNAMIDMARSICGNDCEITIDTIEAHYWNYKTQLNIATVLRVVPIKYVKTMLLAYQYVKEELPNTQLAILGGYEENPAYYEECLELIQSLRIENVTFYGQVNIKDYLPDIDLLLLSSISEGQPLAMLEGMAAGIPFVSTNVGDCKGLLEGNPGDTLGKAGIIVPVMDSRAMAEAILTLAKNPALRKEMGDIGKQRVKSYYQKEFFLRQYDALYQELYSETGGKLDGGDWI